MGALVAFVAAATFGAVMVVLPGSAGAGGGPLALVVDTLEDDFGFDIGDNECDDGPGGTCSLREAVALAEDNGGAGGDITFSVNGTTVLAREIVLISSGDVTITGNGVGETILTVDPRVELFRGGNGGELRHFYVQQADLTLEDMTLRDGVASDGGSVHVAWQGALTTEDVHFLANTALDDGGAIHANADNDTIDVRSTTFAGNEADTGGAISIGNDTGTISNSTFTDNSAEVGAAIFVSWRGTLRVDWSTFSQNVLLEEQVAANSQSFQSMRSTAAAPQGIPPELVATIVAQNPGKGDRVGDVTVSHSILEKTSGNGTDECGGPIISGGANIVDDLSCGFVAALDEEETPSNVGPLQDNGGPTFTMALTADSAAVDVDPALCKLNDQRDLPRNVDGDDDGTEACDSGAYELQATPDETTTTSTTAPDDDGDVDADTATPATPTVARPTFTG